MCRLGIAINALFAMSSRLPGSFRAYIKGEPTDFQTISRLYETDDNLDHR